MEELLNLLFYFKRLKVNMAFCVLLSFTSCSNEKLLEIKESNTIFELSDNAQLKLKDSKVDGKVILKDNAKIITENTKLAPVGVTESKIYIKLSSQIQMEYTNFLNLKERFAAKDFKESESVLKMLDKIDKLDNYVFESL